MNTDESKNVALFSFSTWITQGFWLALAYKWHLSFAGLIIVCSQNLLLVSATRLFQVHEGDPYLLIMSGVFAALGLLFYPIMSIGFVTLIHKIDSKTFEPDQFFKLLLSGFGVSFYRLLSLGGFLLFAHVVFALIMGTLAAITQSMALQSNTDITSNVFIQYQNITLLFGFVMFYPFVIASFIFSPLLIAFESDTPVLKAMLKSWSIVTSNLLSFVLFILFALLSFVFFIFSLSLIPAVLIGLLAMLPWDNKFAALQSLMVLPLLAAITGLCFCIAWFYCAIYQAYKALLTTINS